MTDNEIIKALDICGHLEACADCPLGGLEGVDKCMHTLLLNALDLINRQKAEIEELKSDIAILKDSNINLQELYYTEKEKVTQAKTKVVDACKMRKTAKSETIKEFAERLKESAFDCDVSFGYGREHYTKAVSVIEIDNLVKEVFHE